MLENISLTYPTTLLKLCDPRHTVENNVVIFFKICFWETLFPNPVSFTSSYDAEGAGHLDYSQFLHSLVGLLVTDRLRPTLPHLPPPSTRLCLHSPLSGCLLWLWYW